MLSETQLTLSNHICTFNVNLELVLGCKRHCDVDMPLIEYRKVRSAFPCQLECIQGIGIPQCKLLF